MPSIKKRVTGFIRQFSAPSVTGGDPGGGGGGVRTGSDKAGKRRPEIKVTSATITDDAFHQKAAAGCFIQKYLNGESHSAGPNIFSGKTGHDLPVHNIDHDDLDPEVFATYTGPDGGVTSISKLEDKLHTTMQEADDSEDFDYIDIEDVVGSRPRRPSSAEEPEVIDCNLGESILCCQTLIFICYVYLSPFFSESGAPIDEVK